MTSRTLEDRLDSRPEGWRPTPGDKLTGTVVGLDERDSDYGEPYPVVTIACDDDREVAVHGFHTVLRRELARQRPQVGDRIGVAYHGKSDRGYERYRVIVEHDEPTQAVDWDHQARIADGDGEPEPAPQSDVPADPSPEPPAQPDDSEKDDIPF